GHQAIARHAGEELAQAAAHRALQAVAAQTDAVEQQRHAAEQRQQHAHGAASERAAMAPRCRCVGARSPARWAVSLSDTRRGGRTTVSEALSTRSRQSWLNEQPSRWQA